MCMIYMEKEKRLRRNLLNNLFTFLSLKIKLNNIFPFMIVFIQASKLGLSKNKKIICSFPSYQVWYLCNKTLAKWEIASTYLRTYFVATQHFLIWPPCVLMYISVCCCIHVAYISFVLVNVVQCFACLARSSNKVRYTHACLKFTMCVIIWPP